MRMYKKAQKRLIKTLCEGEYCFPICRIVVGIAEECKYKISEDQIVSAALGILLYRYTKDLAKEAKADLSMVLAEFINQAKIHNKTDCEKAIAILAKIK